MSAPLWLFCAATILVVASLVHAARRGAWDITARTWLGIAAFFVLMALALRWHTS